ncbi:hypothetical protein HDV00_007671 [Rhizophlyctis rosea]|nr:hypothetical protein HDV00_007671 [Rhizophlyctis rosea]
MRTIETLCRDLRFIMRNPHIVMHLFMSEAPCHAFGALNRFPRWANNAKLRDLLFEGPKPPLYFLEKFLNKARVKGVSEQAKIDIEIRSRKWYRKIDSTSPPLLHYSPSAFRFFARIYSPDVLKEMLDDEMFPLGEFFKEIGKDIDEPYLTNPVIQKRVKLRDLIPRLTYNHGNLQTTKFANQHYSSASSSEQIEFRYHLLGLLNSLTGENEWGCQNTFIGICPPIVETALLPVFKDRYPHLRLCFAIRSTPVNLPEIHYQTTKNGQTLSEHYLSQEAEYLDRSRLPFTGWCYAIGLLQTPETQGTIRTLIRDSLLRALWSATLGGKVSQGTMYARETLEDIVDAMAYGSIDWRPSIETILEFKQQFTKRYGCFDFMFKSDRTPSRIDKKRKRIERWMGWMVDVFATAREGLKERGEGAERADGTGGKMGSGEVSRSKYSDRDRSTEWMSANGRASSRRLKAMPKSGSSDNEEPVSFTKPSR